MSSNGMEKESSQPKTQRLSEATLPSSHEQAPSKTIAWGKKKNVDVNWLLKVYPSAKIEPNAEGDWRDNMETLWDTGWHDWRKQMGTSNTQASVFSARRYPPSAEPTSSEGNSKWSKNKVVTLLEKAASSCSKHRATKRQSSIIVPQFDQISATRFTTEYLIAKGNLKEASVLGDLNSHIAAEISARLVVVEAALKLDQPPAKWFGYTSRAEFANEIAETAEGLGASKILRTEVSKTGKTKTLQLYMDIVRGIAVRNNVTTHPGEITKIWHRFDPVLQTICTEGKEIP